MMDGGAFPDLQTGASLKQVEEADYNLRVTTTEAHDIFDDEIWNNSMCMMPPCGGTVAPIGNAAGLVEQSIHSL